jgi:hypothetical protein
VVLFVVSCVMLVVMVDDKSIGVVVVSDSVLGGISPPRIGTVACHNVAGRKVHPKCRLDLAKDTAVPGDATTIPPGNSVDKPKKHHDVKISGTTNDNESLGRIKIPLLLMR